MDENTKNPPTNGVNSGYNVPVMYNSTDSGQSLKADKARTTPKPKMIAMYKPRNFKKASSDSSTTVRSDSPFAAAIAAESTETCARLVDFPSLRFLFDLEPNSNGSDDDETDNVAAESSLSFCCCSSLAADALVLVLVVVVVVIKYLFLLILLILS